MDNALEALQSDEQGRLHAVYGSKIHIIAPPHVEIRPCLAGNDRRETLCLVYQPVPAKWHQGIDMPNWHELLAVGWRERQDVSRLPQDFLALAPDFDAELDDSLIADLAKKVAQFATQWGPLWLCATPKHRGFFNEGPCFVPSPFYSFYQWMGEPPCSWRPYELISSFVHEAWRVKAAIETFALLERGEAVPERVKRHLYQVEARVLQEKELDHVAMILTVNKYLMSLTGPRECFWWDPDHRPKVLLTDGDGFLPNVWRQLVQIICQTHGIMQCDGCGESYIREGRKAPTGRNNFCPTCRTNDRGSKRRYAQRKLRRKRPTENARNS